MSRNVAIVGAGPAGLMAAEVLAGHGLHVDLFERMASPARKFLMAGRGGLNLTHSEPLPAFLARYGDEAAHMAPLLREMSPDDLRAWAAGLGEETFVGSSGRVFPKSFKASPLLRAWLKRLDGLGVRLHSRYCWHGWSAGGALLFATPLGEREVEADAVLFALGGASWPRLGSDGGWVRPFAARGVAIDPLKPANCGFRTIWSEGFAARFAGAPLKSVRLHHKDHVVQGEAMITREGIEGGAVYALSHRLRTTIENEGEAVLHIDLRPHQDGEAIAGRLARAGRQSLSNRLRRAGFDALAAGLLRDATSNDLPTEAGDLARLIKAVPLRLVATTGIERAISTAGGVSWQALDDTLMLRALPGTFVAGEMLSFDAPTGGYLLQGCLSSGAHAAHCILRFLGISQCQ